MQTYPSVLIHPSLPSGRCSGELQLNASYVEFKSAEMQYSIPYSQLDLSAGGSGNRFVFFKDKHQSETSIYTGDKSVLKHPNLQRFHELTDSISKSRKVTRGLLVTSLVVIGIVVGLIAGLFLFKDKMIEKAAHKIPVKWENQIGDKLFSTLSLQYKFVQIDSLKQAFMEVAKPLFTEIEKEGFTIDVYFVNEPSINAFALPGGKVIIQTGLVENAKSWEEVLGVLSHEIAHVTRRHHVRSIINNMGIFALVSLTLGDVSAVIATIGNVGGNLATLANSRTFEYEADETGWNYLVNTGINPNGMITFFETLDKQSATKADSIMSQTIDLSFLSTHPDTKDRIEKLKEKEKALNVQFITLPSNFVAFNEDLQRIKQE